MQRLQFGRHCRGHSIHRRLIVFISVTHVASLSHFIPGIPQPLELVTRGGFSERQKRSTAQILTRRMILETTNKILFALVVSTAFKPTWSETTLDLLLPGRTG